MSCFVKRDVGIGHRAPGKAVDCQVRALVVALEMDYNDAWHLLYTMQGERRWCSFGLVEDLKSRDSRLHVVRALSFPAVRGKPRMTGAMFCDRYKTGHFILRMAHHMAAVVGGKLYDSWDSTRKCIYTAWEVKP
jgi:hypothetical protein